LSRKNKRLGYRLLQSGVAADREHEHHVADESAARAQPAQPVGAFVRYIEGTFAFASYDAR
jgi:hypothetical protein